MEVSYTLKGYRVSTLFYLTNIASHFPSARLTCNIVMFYERVCKMRRVSASWVNVFAAPSVNVARRDITLTAIHWTVQHLGLDLQQISGVPRNFVREGFNKFS